MSISIRDIALECGISEIHQDLIELWSKKVTKTNNTDILKFLDEKVLLNIAEQINMSSSAMDSLNTAAKIVRNSDNLKALYLLMHSFVFYTKGTFIHIGEGWIYPRRELKEYATLFPLLVFISGIENVKKSYSEYKYNWPEVLLSELFKYIKVKMEYFYKENGVWGIGDVDFFLYYFRNEIFSIGSLRYIYKEWNYNNCAIVYRNKKTMEVVAFSEPGVKYRNDGLVNGTNNEFDDEAWTATFENTDKIIRGNILKDGYACKEVLTLSADIWERILKRHMPVLDIHILIGTSLKPYDVKQSLKNAILFFKEHFPSNEYTAFTCNSWLLNPKLKKILKGESNLIQFQNIFHTYPVLSSDKGTLKFVFGSNFDINTAPRDTSLRRGIIELMENGEKFNNAAGFLLKDEV